MFTRKPDNSQILKAGITGAVVGAVGTAVAISLSDEKTRDKVFAKMGEVKGKMNSLKEHGQKEVKKLQNGTHKLGKTA